MPKITPKPLVLFKDNELPQVLDFDLFERAQSLITCCPCTLFYPSI